jgi:hypothetical protein
MDKASAAVAAAESEVKAKLAAIGRVEATISAKEAQLTGILDAQARKATVETLEVRERRFRAAHAALLKGLREYTEAAGDLAPVIIEARQLEIFADALATTDLPTAATLVTTLVGNHIAAVKAGSAPAGLPQAGAAAPTTTTASPVLATTRIFTLQGVRWREPSNVAMTRYHPQYADLDLPRDLAAQAFAANIAITITDARVRDLKRQHAPKNLHPDQCSWIGDPGDDEPATVPNGERIMHSAFGN